MQMVYPDGKFGEEMNGYQFLPKANINIDVPKQPTCHASNDASVLIKFENTLGRYNINLSGGLNNIRLTASVDSLIDIGIFNKDSRQILIDQRYVNKVTETLTDGSTSGKVFTDGTYTIEVFGGGVCDVVGSFKITSPPPITLSVTRTEISPTKFHTKGPNETGTITLKAGGGKEGSEFYYGLSQGPFYYVSNYLPFTGELNKEVLKDVNNLSSYKIKTNNNCYLISDTVKFTMPAALSITLDTADCHPPSCSTINSSITGKLEDGKIKATASGGSLNYKFILHTKQADGTFTAGRIPSNYYTVTSYSRNVFPEGIYKIEVLDELGNTAITSEIKLETPVIEPNAIADIALPCNGAETPLSLTDTPNYVMEFKTETDFSTYTTSTKFAAGKHTMRYYSDKSKICYQDQEFTVTQPQKLSISNPISTNTTCAAAANGTYTFEIEGGLPNNGFTVAFETKPGSNTPAYIINDRNVVLSKLLAGDYTVKISNGVGCSINHEFKILSASSFSVTNSQTMPLCALASDVNNTYGKIKFSVTNHTGNLTISDNDIPSAYTNNSEYLVKDISTSHVFIVSDEVGCSLSETISFSYNTNTLALIQPLTSTNVSCAGGTDGSVTLGVSGGFNADGTLQTSDYKYSYQPDSQLVAVALESYTYTGLTNNTYTLRVTDGVGCYVETEHRVDVSNETPHAPIVTPISCTGVDDGEVRLGSIPATWENALTYSLKKADGTEMQIDPETKGFKGLSNIGYTLLINSGNGCSKSFNISFLGNKNNNDKISIVPLAINSPSCPNSDDGTVQVTVTTSAEGVYINSLMAYFNDTKVGQVSANYVVSGLKQQKITLKATDNVGCTKEVAYTPEASTNPLTLVTAKANPVSCSASLKGTISCSAEGGNGTYTFNLFRENDQTAIKTETGTEISFTGLGAKNKYYVILTDGTCEVQSDYLTFATQAPTITCNGNLVLDCIGYNNGSITASITNAINTASYHYLLYKKDEKIVNGETVSNDVLKTSFSDKKPTDKVLFEDLYAGLYKVEVYEDDNCKFNYPDLSIKDPSPIEIGEFSTTCISKTGEETGVFSIAASGGSNSYNYKWISGDKSEEGKFSQASPFEKTKLKAGIYTFQLQDEKGCRYSDNAEWYEKEVVIHQPKEALSFTYALTPETCNGSNDAKICIMASGGWTCDEHINCKNEAHNNCPNWSDIPCEASPYLYKIGEDGLWRCDSIFYYVKSGEYTIYVKDKAGEVVNGTIVVYSRPKLTLAINSEVGATCPGYANGFVTATTTNGVKNANEHFTYTISGISTAIEQGELFNYRLGAGEYTLTVTDLNQCNADRRFTIDEPLPPVITVTANVISDKGQATGNIDVSLLNGSGIYNYKWLKVGSADVLKEGVYEKGSHQLTNLLAGDYILHVQDTATCVFEGNNSWMQRAVTIKEPDLALAFKTQIATAATCYNYNNGKALVQAEGGWGSSYLYAIDGEAWQTSGEFTLLPTGLHFIQIKDEAGVVRRWDFEITQPLPFGMVLDPVVNTSCQTYSNGGVKATIQNGINSFTGLNYTISQLEPIKKEVVTLQSFNRRFAYTQLPKGEYELLVTDANQCVTSQKFEVKEPLTPTIKITNNYLKTIGERTGHILATVTNGNQGFNYKCYWNDDEQPFKQGFTSSTIELKNLQAGTYFIAISDTANCVFGSSAWMRWTVLMKEPSQPLAITVPTNKPISCFGQTDGLLQIQPVGGWGEYSIYLDQQLVDTRTFENLSAKTYAITVVDSAGISVSKTFDFIEPDLLSASYNSHQNISCYNGKDGAITLNLVGGSAPYYLSSDQQTWMAGTSLSNLPVGNYTAFVKDSRNCLAQVPNITLTQPNAIAKVSERISYPQCLANTGSIDAIFEGGTGLLSYRWVMIADDYSSKTELKNQTSASVNGLFASRYQVIVTDENACVKPFDFAVGNATDLTIETISTQAISCFGDTDGTAIAQVVNGTAPYSYSWSGSTASTLSNEATQLSPGTYNLLVVDAEKCKTIKEFTINSPLPISYHLNELLQPFCRGGAKGIIDVLGSGGTPGYSYLWSNGSTQSTNTALDPGKYTLTLTDANRCATDFDFEMSYQKTIVPFIGNDTTICQGQNLVVYGGDYQTFSWTSNHNYSSSNRSVTLSEPAEYFLKVQDKDLCLGFDTLKLALSYLNIDKVEVKPVSCFNAKDGKAEVVVSPANWQHTILWPDGSHNATFEHLSGGIYTVEVVDKYHCKAKQSFVVIEPQVLQHVSNLTKDPLCNAKADGFVFAEVKGGTLPYSVSWSNGATEPSIYHLDKGVYQVRVTDANNCYFEKTYSLNYQRLINPNVGNDTTLCAPKSLVLDAGLYHTYQWTSKLNGSTTKRQWTVNKADTYYLAVTDNDNCFGNDSIRVDVSDVKLDKLVTRDLSCNGDANGWASIETTPSVWPSVIEWSNGTIGTKNQGLSGGNYWVRATNNIGCQDRKEFSIVEPSRLFIKSSKTLDPLCFGVYNGSIDVLASGGLPDYTYTWQHGAKSSSLSKLDRGHYAVTVTDVNNCMVTQAFNLKYQRAVKPDLGPDRIICKDNAVRLYAGLYNSYQWRNATVNLGNDSSIQVAQANVYYLDIKDEYKCIGQDTINIKTRPYDLKAEFLMASNVSVGDTLLIVEVSRPKPDAFTWNFTGKHKVVEVATYYSKVVFEEEGVHEVLLEAYVNGCLSQSIKPILVSKAHEAGGDEDENEPINVKIATVTASPNPCDGIFTAKVALHDINPVTFYLVNIGNGQIIEKRKRQGQKDYEEVFNAGRTGNYILFTEVGDERRAVKVVVY